MTAKIIVFPNSNAPQHGDECLCDKCYVPVKNHVGKCPCEECCSKRRILATMKERTNSEIVRDYENSLMKGLDNWAENPRASLFEAVTEQLIADGIVRS